MARWATGALPLATYARDGTLRHSVVFGVAAAAVVAVTWKRFPWWRLTLLIVTNCNVCAGSIAAVGWLRAVQTTPAP